ncbi:MAG: metallophosphoesterase [Eubacteriales bacterium]|nr:metallophosphoesterase [Eubacteriales bacterium]
MRVFAIADLHLSGAVDKPMDIYGSAWDRHPFRMEKAWRECVQETDVVLIPGDISWAMHMEDALVDLRYLHTLPGVKILLRGNHDYWWNSVSKLRARLPESMRAIQNDSLVLQDTCIGGTRGWVCPGSAGFEACDQKIYDREVKRLELSLSSMPQVKNRIVMLHYPPFNERREPSGFTELLERYEIATVVYGHLHGKSCKGAFCGERNGVHYQLVSADHLDFTPHLLLES